MMDVRTITQIKPANEIRFCIESTWILAITKKGFMFNHEAFPTGTPEEFADRFVKILEKHFNVKFTKKTSERRS